MDLPAPLEIKRADFEQQNFSPHDFLLEHCQFRNLGDLSRQVTEWEDLLKNELEVLVNENYNDLLSAKDSLTEAKEDLENMKLRVLQYEAEIGKIAQQTDKARHQAEAEYAEQTQLRRSEHDLKQLIAFVERIDKLNSLPSTLGEFQLAQLSRLIVTLEIVASEYPSATVVKDNLERLRSHKKSVLSLINEKLHASPSLELAVAKSWLLN